MPDERTPDERTPDEELSPVLDRVRDTYNVPPETPTERMWTAISGQLSDADPTVATEADVIDLAAQRRLRAVPSRRAVKWAVAAAAVLVTGVGIGRMTAPAVPGGVAVRSTAVGRGALTLAARDHLGRTESLLTMVRADARAGGVDAVTGAWASGLLSQTRLLIDSGRGTDPAVDDLLLDLELLLVQIVGVSQSGQSGSMDEARARTELELALRSLEDGEVLSRIQAILPEDMAGT